MVGLCGTLGEQNIDIDSFSDSLYFHGNEERHTYENNNLSVAYVDHPQCAEPQPIEVEDDLFWIWGIVVGHERKGNYTSKPKKVSQGEYSSILYDEHGLPFVAGLNSDFTGLIYHGDEEKVSFFTDRLGSRPIYYTQTDNGSLVFSSLLQSLRTHPHVSVDVNPDFLSEFLHYDRSLGIYTPLEGVYQLPPASVVTFDMDGRKVDEWTYWWPSPSPTGRPFSAYVEEFAQTLETVMQERLPIEDEVGLLLSGGVDSRAILAASNGNLTCFHMNESIDRNKEEWIAKHAAETVDTDFRFLERDINYFPSVLKKIRSISNLNGSFDEAHAIGFSEKINSEVNHLICGQYSDTVLGGTYVPKSNENVKNIDTVDDYVREFDNGTMGGNPKNMGFSTELPNRTDVLKPYINSTGIGVNSHGVSFPSWQSLVQFGIVYPITNARTFVFYETNQQMIPTHYPYIDNRIIDMVLQTAEYRYSHDVVKKALQQLDTELASVESRLPITISNKYVNHLLTTPPRKLPNDLLKFVGVLDNDISSSQTHLSTGPWADRDGLIRSHNFVEQTLEKQKAGIRMCPYLDYVSAFDSYDLHMDGQNRRRELFALLSFVETDIFKCIYNERDGDN